MGLATTKCYFSKEMSLKVIVKNATRLPDLKDEDGVLDPYVAVKFRGMYNLL